MAKMVSFISTGGGIDPDKNYIESKMLILENIIKNKEVESKYAEVLELISSIYYSVTIKEELLSIIKTRFQGNYTRGIYTLILQYAVEFLTEQYLNPNKPRPDFSKYLDLVVDKDDIKITSDEFGDKLKAFNTKVDIKINNSYYWPSNKSLELENIIKELGAVGTFFFFKALFKVVVVVR